MGLSNINILGINAYHGDSSAALAKAGKLIAAVEEERFVREKHWAGLPVNAIKYCLRAGGMDISDIDYIALSKNPFTHISEKIYRAISISPAKTLNRIRANTNILSVKDSLRRILPRGNSIKARVVYVEHHPAHLALAHYAAPFRKGLIVSCDGAGDMRTAMWATAENGRLNIRGKIRFPHSLGFLYTAFTQFLGFSEYADEYKVMGLSSYGQPNYTGPIGKMLRIKKNGTFSLDLSYFNIDKNLSSMTWMDCRPHIGRLYSDKFVKDLGQPRLPGQPITQRHKDIARSLQGIVEKAILHLIIRLKAKSGQENLCLSGGVFANSVVCGKLSGLKLFANTYVPCAPGDAGLAIGALAHFYYKKTGKIVKNIGSALLGPAYKGHEIKKALEVKRLKYERLTEEQMLDCAVSLLVDKKIVGWFQGRMEFGYRALGNRSILAHPGDARMKELLNKRIKNREDFRPFAASVMQDRALEFFHLHDYSPYMSFVLPVKQDQLDRIRAVVHADNTTRVHTVAKKDNPLFYKLLQRFYRRTNLALLLNTSFNEQEPIVNNPQQAIDCFLRTRMDALIIGNFVLKK